MKLIEALRISQQPSPRGAPASRIFLACGFTPLHLETYLRAHLRLLSPASDLRLSTGLYGDLAGNLDRLKNGAVDSCAIAIEWSDLDPRLGLRSLGGWSPASLPDIVRTVRERVDRLNRAIERLARDTTVAVSLPTLPLPPVAFTPAWRAGAFEWEVRAALLGLTRNASSVAMLSPQKVDSMSPMGERSDVASELHSGFPYTKEHAAILAELLARALYPPAPKKGLITDLDDTLWKGIVGEVGSAAVGWDLNGQAQIHGLYQQCLGSLAEAGVMVAVASKNDPAIVAAALDRSDLAMRRDRLFPVEVHWKPKSESVARILSAWNVSADAVVFVDDSPLELAEVEQAFPEITALRFPSQDAPAAWRLIEELRDWFGKDALSREDSLRVASLRQASELGEAATRDGRSSDDFLRDLEAVITVDAQKEPPPKRAYELVNKTNQFNMNGARFSWAEWCALLKDENAFQWLMSYRDKFGPLGGIAVLVGRRDGGTIQVKTWVMSCRAFSRHIEHMSLRRLFEQEGVDEVVLDVLTTPRNSPFREFVSSYVPWPEEGPAHITRAAFEAGCPALHLQVQEAQIA
ncbi:MAG TPA: HAD-IIIC family phosphatase [Gemmatimonadaceae bacterium]